MLEPDGWIRRRGQWKPGLQPDLAAVAMFAYGTETLIRSVDYLTGDREGVTSSLTVVEQALPLPAWGLLCFVAAATFLIGMWRRRFGAVIAGSVLAMAAYGALAAGLAVRVFQLGWPPDGFRTAVQFVLVSLMFGLFAVSASLRRASETATDHLCNDGGEETLDDARGSAA